MPISEFEILNDSMTSDGPKAAVIGAGLAGIAAAGLLARRGFETTLIDAADSLGGLLSSRYDSQGRSFDYGTHVLEETGIEDLDEVLYGALKRKNGWHMHSSCPSSCYFGGSLSHNGFIDARALSGDLYEKGVGAMLDLLPPADEAHTLRNQLDATFGVPFRQSIFDPALGKLLGRSTDELAPNSHTLFGLKRLLCGSPEEALRWKAESEWNDHRFAFHDTARGARLTHHLYPKEGGMGAWARSIERQFANEENVRTILGEQVQSLAMDGRSVTRLELRDGQSLEVDLVAWSAPLFPLIKLLQVSPPEGLVSPQFCQTVLVDLLVNRPPQVETFYVSCFDPKLRNFRTTIYGELENNRGASPARVTVEVMIPPTATESAPVVPEDILGELVGMGVFSSDSALMDSHVTTIERGFPVMTTQFATSSHLLRSAVESSAENVLVLGRASGRGFFMSEILRDVHEQITAL